jgi:hypothetical protein
VRDFFFTIGGEPRQVVIELGELDNGVEVVSPTASGLLYNSHEVVRVLVRRFFPSLRESGFENISF